MSDKHDAPATGQAGKDADHSLALRAGEENVEDQIVYVVLLADGSQRTHASAEFAKQFGWKNDPENAAATWQIVTFARVWAEVGDCLKTHTLASVATMWARGVRKHVSALVAERPRDGRRGFQPTVGRSRLLTRIIHRVETECRISFNRKPKASAPSWRGVIHFQTRRARLRLAVKRVQAIRRFIHE